jgi:putative ABC transport system substrate-binding protein
MRRRELITLVGGAAAWPLAARAERSDRVRRVSALMSLPESYPETQARRIAFEQALSKLGWTIGRNLMVDYRWEISNVDRARTATAELLAFAPDAILAIGTPAALATKSSTGTVPVVFVAVSEPVSQRYRREPGSSRRQSNRFYESESEFRSEVARAS